jgi:hypothetical protein
MTRRGRRPSGAKLVDRLEGSRHAKRRTKVILETLSQKMTIAEACAALGIGEAAFHKLRTRFLREAVESLEPRPLGRRPEQHEVNPEEVDALRREVEDLRRELEAARIREEVALAMPHLVKGQKKKRKR